VNARVIAATATDVDAAGEVRATTEVSAATEVRVAGFGLAGEAGQSQGQDRSTDEEREASHDLFAFLVRYWDARRIPSVYCAAVGPVVFCTDLQTRVS
jgi:hypothetical protein